MTSQASLTFVITDEIDALAYAMKHAEKEVLL
jgi:hypothetical protein